MQLTQVPYAIAAAIPVRCCCLPCLCVQVCQVYDSAEACRNVHSEPQWRQAASQACQVCVASPLVHHLLLPGLWLGMASSRPDARLARLCMHDVQNILLYARTMLAERCASMHVIM
jgi:hypothetical protein